MIIFASDCFRIVSSRSQRPSEFVAHMNLQCKQRKCQSPQRRLANRSRNRQRGLRSVIVFTKAWIMTSGNAQHEKRNVQSVTDWTILRCTIKSNIPRSYNKGTRKSTKKGSQSTTWKTYRLRWEYSQRSVLLDHGHQTQGSKHQPTACQHPSSN